MVWAVFFLMGALLIAAETSLFHLFPDFLGKPDLLFIVIVFVAYKFRWGSGLLYVYSLGWMMDVVSGIHPGIYPLHNILVFSVVKIVSENSPLKENTYQVPLVAFSYFFMQMLMFLLYSMFAPGTLPPWSWNRVLQETIILLLATIPIFILLNSLYEFFAKRRVIRSVIKKRAPTNQFR